MNSIPAIIFAAPIFVSNLERTDLFAREVKGWDHTAGKPIRLVARMVCMLAMAALLSPLDALYQTAKVLEHPYQWIRATTLGVKTVQKKA